MARSILRVAYWAVGLVWMVSHGPAVPGWAAEAGGEVSAAEAAATEVGGAEPEAAMSRLAQALAAGARQPASNRLAVGDICEVKHYKQGTLEGFGLVLDLEGLAGPRSTRAVVTEEESAPAMEPVELLKLLNDAMSQEDPAAGIPEGLLDARHVTLVVVTATVPSEGIREGDRIDCQVRAFNGSSVEDGFLLATELFAPGPRKETPLAVAAGPILSAARAAGAGGTVTAGCLALADVCDEFIRDGKITLILDEEHADFLVAQEIANLINTQIAVTSGGPLARALNRFNIEVTVPKSFEEDPVLFVTQVLQLATQIPVSDEES